MSDKTAPILIGLMVVLACGGGGGADPADVTDPGQEVSSVQDLPPMPVDAPVQDKGTVPKDVSSYDLPVTDEGGGKDVNGDPGQPSGSCLPTAPPDQAGVAYIAHFLSTELRIYRLDGPKPVAEAPLETGGYSHDLALDAHNDLLFQVQDVGRKVQIYRVYRPSRAGSFIPAPFKVSEIPFGDDTPRFAVTDPLRKRLFVVADPPLGDGVLEKHLLYVYDLSDPATPVPAAGSPMEIPVTTTLALDALIGALFMVGLTDDNLHLYDVSGTGPMPTVLGNPLSLVALYPQENQFTFQARNLTLNPWKGRMYAARAQSALSEVIAFDYDPSPATTGAPCPELPLPAGLGHVSDFFDVDKPVEDRPNLLDAFQVVPEPGTGNTFLVANAWNGTASSSLVIPLDPQLSPATGCADWEGMGCWYRSWFNGNPGFHQVTDGAACLDRSHRVFVGSTYDVYNEEDPGSVLFFHYQEDLTMTPWLADGDKTLAAGSLPVAAVCH